MILLANLPDDLIFEIIKNLDFPDVFPFYLTNKKCNSVCKTELAKKVISKKYLKHRIDKCFRKLHEDGVDLAYTLKDYHITQKCNNINPTYFDKYLEEVSIRMSEFYQKNLHLYLDVIKQAYFSETPNSNVSEPTPLNIQTMFEETDNCYLPWVLFEDHMPQIDPIREKIDFNFIKSNIELIPILLY